MLEPLHPALRAMSTAPAPIINTLTQELLGRDRRALFGAEGKPSQPAMTSDSLELGQADRTRLQQTRVYILPGTPWPGVADNGAAWTKPWSDTLRQMGVGRVVPVNYGGGSDVGTFARIFADPVTGAAEKRVMAQISADLKAKPLAQGERIMILGHSFGSLMGGKVAEKLQAKGLPVAGMIMLETHLPDVGQFAKKAPALPRVVEVENEARTKLQVSGKSKFDRVYVPQLSHMDIVMRPPASLMRQIVRELAAP